MCRLLYHFPIHIVCVHSEWQRHLLTFCTQRKRDQIENVAEKNVYFFTNLCIFSAKLLSHFIESHMYVLGKEESDFLLCHCNMDRTKRRRKKNINIREEAEKKRKRIILKKKWRRRRVRTESCAYMWAPQFAYIWCTHNSVTSNG